MDKIIRKSYTDFTQENNSLDETLFHNANGYIGVRGALEEGVPAGWDTMRGMYINGFYDIIPMKQAEMLCNFVDKKETMLNVADTMSVNCIVDGEMFDMSKGTLISHVRELDMSKGVTRRSVVWESSSGKRIQLDVTRMTSFELLSLFTIEYKVTALNFEGDIKFISSHNPNVSNYCNPNDPRLAAESLKNLTVQGVTLSEGCSVAISKTSVSGLSMCSLVKNEVYYEESNEPVEGKTEVFGEQSAYSAICHLAEGKSAVLTKISIFSDSVRKRDFAGSVKSDYEIFRQNSLKHYYVAQKSYLDDFWNKCEMEIDGDEDTNRSVAFNMYELLCSAAKDPFASIAAKGMSGEGYEGHYFWDTETFVLPFFTLTNPALSRMLLNYRYKTLNKARENAKLLGHSKGALFPWRTITGTECSGYFVSGSAAYHINADIAYACVNYYLTTGDLDFMAETGAEILIETARLWMDLGNYNPDGKFVLNAVTGPDEYTCMINNNYYTNVAAKYNLNWAAKIYRLLEEKGLTGELDRKLCIGKNEPDDFIAAADKMLLLYDERLGINPQDDSFLSKPVWNLEETPKNQFPLLLHYHPLCLYRYQVCKQADTVLAYFMFENEQSAEVMKRSYEYYEKITTHDSSLSTCVFSIVAGRLGMKEKAYSYFGDSAKLDLMNTHNNTKHGIHTANMGGCYMAIVNGFAALRIDEDGVSLAPFVPGDWTGYRFKFVYKGSLIKVSVNTGEVTVELLRGDEITIGLYDKKYELNKTAKVVVKVEEKK